MTDQDRATQDYLFDLNGYRILKNALSPEDLAEINGWVDARQAEELAEGQWVGDVECQSYQGHDGMSFHNMIEAGPAFRKCIDHPAWVDEVSRYVATDRQKLAIDENFLNVRAQGGFIGIHSGGHVPGFTSCFRHHTGDWMVGMINVLMALTDIGPGDGCTTIVPGSHKSHATHPALAGGGRWGTVANDDVSGDGATGMIEVHLKAGDALMFTDAACHGSTARTNPGERRVMIYRYVPSLMARRYNYVPSEELLSELTDRQQSIIQPTPIRMRPGRTMSSNDRGRVLA